MIHSTKHSSLIIILLFLKSISEYDGDEITAIYDKIPSRTSLKRSAIQVIISDLCRFEFCKIQNPWLPDGKDRLKLLDCPLRLTLTNDFESLQGTILEEIFRQLLEESKCLNAKIIDNYWAEHCTEIDVVAEDEQKRIVYWGSCKRNPLKQSPWNLLCHIISFFNNRDYSNHPWYEWSHQLVFLSPIFEEETSKNLSDMTQILNDWIEKSSKEDVVIKCKSILSDYQENRGRKKKKKKEELTTFTPAPDMPETISLRISGCSTYDLQQLILFK